METNKPKRRWPKVLLITTSVILVLVCIAALFINGYLASKLSKKLQAAVLQGSDSLYSIEPGNVKLSILQGKATVYNIQLKPNLSLYREKKKRNVQVPNTLYSLQVQRVIITGVKLSDLYFNKELNIDKITVEQPEITSGTYANQPDTGTKDKRTLYQKISGTFRAVSLGKIILSNIRLKSINYTGKKPVFTSFKDLDIIGNDLLISKDSQQDTSRFLFFKDVNTTLRNYTSRSADGLYTFKVKQVSLSTRHQKLSIKGIDLIPLPYPEFFEKSKKDRFKLHLQNITLHNFDISAYRSTQIVSVEKAVIDTGVMELYSNYNGTPKTTDRLVTFPNWAVRNLLPMPVNVDTLNVKQMAFTYAERNGKSKKFGYLKFSDINGRFLNITNRKSLLQKNPICTANISSLFLGKTKFNLHFTFNLTDANYSYSYKGHLAPLNLTTVNPVLMPLAMVKINKGQLTSFDFNVISTQKKSKGTVSFLYKDLNVDVLRPDYTKNTLISTLTNTFVLKHDNPDDGSRTPRLANVIYIRAASFPFFKTIWHVLLNGIKNCAGIGPAQEKKLEAGDHADDKKEQDKLLKKAKEEKEKEDKKFKEKLKKKN
ncbi:hypothetical protein CKK33_02535 [Mucilaginibacter sp. MD40]|uniref:hypothetical protein n=1 Tax=Mucilaginibacter sp. MD40 TaxID=2029590 RepID=UPI000BAC7779|nr:hypothetical protein [Mucilaginibacter sp. MD40]PAW92430.1 hypothetical protein CKK33_02535 [Mucilaginibacter sp. MD40]